MTPANIISMARTTMHDTRTPYRNSDDILLVDVNDAVDAAYKAVPSLFYAIGEITCVPYETIQRVCIADAGKIIDIPRVKGGRALTVFDKKALDAFDPDWHQGTPGEAIHWQRLLDDPVRFYVYPPAPENQILEIVYLPSPVTYTLNETLPLPDAMLGTLHDYVMARVYARDKEEEGNANLAASYLKLFAETVGTFA